MSHHLGTYTSGRSLWLIVDHVSPASGRASEHQLRHSLEGFTEPNLPGNVGKILPAKNLGSWGRNKLSTLFFRGRNIENPHNQLKHWLKLVLMEEIRLTT